MSRPKGFRITILSMNMTNQSHRKVYLIPKPGLALFNLFDDTEIKGYKIMRI